jgi:CRP/FNR family transcriptional regulator
MTGAMLHYDELGLNAMDTGAPGTWMCEGTHVSMRELADLLHIECLEEPWLARSVFTLRRVRNGESLLRCGDKFGSLYVVRSGCFKIVLTDFSGSEHVLGFPMRGDMMGADGIGNRHYCSTAIALESSEVVIVPFASPARLADECPELAASLYGVISRELVHAQNMTWALGTLNSESRVAAFLVSFSARLGAMGYSRRSFILRMTRREIGNYLGLKLETVSRALSALHSSGIIRVNQRNIDIVDSDALHGVIDTASLGAARGVARNARFARAFDIRRATLSRKKVTQDRQRGAFMPA